MTDVRRGVVLVTGGSRGIGAASAVALAADGWDVGVNYRTRADEAARVVKACEELGRRAIAVQADVVEADQIERLFDTVTAELGPIGAVINNAGIVSPSGRVAEYDAERLDRVFRINSDQRLPGRRCRGTTDVHGVRRIRRSDRQRVVAGGRARVSRRVRRLCREQGRGRRAHHRPGQRGRQGGRPRPRRPPGPDRDRHPRTGPARAHRYDATAGPSRQGRKKSPR